MMNGTKGAEDRKSVKAPLTSEQRDELRTDIIELIGEMKQPPFENGLAMRTYELQLRQLYFYLNGYYAHVPAAG